MADQIIRFGRTTLEAAQVETDMRREAVLLGKGLVRVEIEYTGKDSMPIKFIGVLE